MRTEPFWIGGPWTGRLAILLRPRGGDWLEDEVRSWRQAGLDAVVSLLTPDEIANFDLVHEADLCEATGIRFLSFPIADRGSPSSGPATLTFVESLEKYLADGKNVGLHCRQGVFRDHFTGQRIDDDASIPQYLDAVIPVDNGSVRSNL